MRKSLLQYLGPAAVIILLIGLLLPLAAQADEGWVPTGRADRFLERSLCWQDTLAKAVTSTGSDTTATTYQNKITVWNKPGGGITYYLLHDSASGYVIPDTAKLQESHRWFLGGSWSTWATVISTAAEGDTITATVPYSTSGKYYDVKLRAIMEEDDSTGTPGSGCVIEAGVIFW